MVYLDTCYLPHLPAFLDSHSSRLSSVCNLGVAEPASIKGHLSGNSQYPQDPLAGMFWEINC